MSHNDLAQEVYKALEANTRADGTPFVRLVEGAPEWVETAVREACQAADCDMDWAYESVRHVSCVLMEYEIDALDDAVHEIADGAVDIYTGELTAWLAQNLQHVSLCESAAEDMGAEFTDLVSYLQRGQFYALEQITASLVESIKNRANEIEIEASKEYADEDLHGPDLCHKKCPCGKGT